MGRHKESDMPAVAQKHKEIHDHWERKATPAIENAGSVLDESTSGCRRRAPSDLKACKVAAAVVAESQLAQGGPNQ